VTVDSALAFAQLLQPSLAFLLWLQQNAACCSCNNFQVLSFIVSFIAGFIALVISPLVYRDEAEEIQC